MVRQRERFKFAALHCIVDSLPISNVLIYSIESGRQPAGAQSLLCLCTGEDNHGNPGRLPAPYPGVLVMSFAVIGLVLLAAWQPLTWQGVRYILTTGVIGAGPGIVVLKEQLTARKGLGIAALTLGLVLVKMA